MNPFAYTLVASTATLTLCLNASGVAAPPVAIGEQGKLQYQTTERGDRIPDFSRCGYAGGAKAPPEISIKVVVEAGEADATHRIQAAIDEVAKMPLDDQGFRGAVYLAPGVHRVAGQLRISVSGIVLRGAGASKQGTTIVATGKSRRPLIRICPSSQAETAAGQPVDIDQAYVPVGATQLELSTASELHPGDRVVVTRPSSKEWIELLDAKVLGVGWREGRCDVRWERTIEKVEERTITLDAPLTCAMDRELATMGTVAAVRSDSKIENVGIEDLQLRSESDDDGPLDEEHSWFGAVANHARDAWMRRLRFQHFAGGAVLLRENCSRVTVEDCLSLAPVSEVGGYRRHSFFTQGGQTLFLRCWAEHGLHDFAVGHCAPGPNAFVNCYAYNTNGDSGPRESWATGVLYDNVRIDGGNLFFGNRWLDPLGAGWSAANCLAWQCQAAQVHSYQPPGAQNWVIGFWAQPVGDGEFYQESDFPRPISLFQQQSLERFGQAAADRVGPFLLNPRAATNPTPAEAEKFVAQSQRPAETLRDLIEQRIRETSPPAVDSTVKHLRDDSTAKAEPTTRHAVAISNGWLTVDGQVLTGGTVSPTWWRGTIRPDDAPEFGPSITRFAPGRYGVGLTDELQDVVDQMSKRGQVAYDHHYGLWYDRRRDDHLMVRRGTSEVMPPFFEQPFARSGQGQAWDGLSRYDLTRYNHWYWSRLADLAALFDQRGNVLIHQCYFQHNILEAGAHWADSPWRPANNVNDTGITEPPPYVGDKRIFIAHQFYAADNKALRDLHRAYLGQCVEALADSTNVIHMTSAEHTGPLEFTRFWLDTMYEHRQQMGAESLIALSATKDVQDGLLAESSEAAKVDLIDIRYWCYTDRGDLYAPPGGINLAPRQHQRQSDAEAGDFMSVAKAVREYRLRYPEKPVMFSAHRECRTPNPGWAVLLSGGSLAEVPPLPDELGRALVGMRPQQEGGEALWLVGDAGARVGYFHESEDYLTLPKMGQVSQYRVRWLDAETGKIVEELEAPAGERLDTLAPVVWLTPIK